MAEAATRHFSQSVEMWQMRLQVLIQLKRDDVTQCFEEAIKHTKSKVCAHLMDLRVLVLGQKPLMIGWFGLWFFLFLCCCWFGFLCLFSVFWLVVFCLLFLFCLQGI